VQNGAWKSSQFTIRSSHGRSPGVHPNGQFIGKKLNPCAVGTWQSALIRRLGQL